MFVNYYYQRIRYHVQEPLKYFMSTSPRKMLFAINFFVAVYSMCLSSFSLFLSSLLYDPGFATGWIVWLGLAIVGICLAITCIIGMRGAHLVSLDLLLTYFWGIIVFIAPLILGTVAAFQFYLFMETWFYHEWPLESFAKMRELFCPENTANGKCLGPLTDGDNDENVLKWCMNNFSNATDCQFIRQHAMSSGVTLFKTLTIAQASLCIFDVLLIAWGIYIVHGILTSPVITQSMNDVINYLLFLPIGGCVAMSYYLWWVGDYQITFSWIAALFCALAIAQFLAFPLGIYAGRFKSKTMLSCYIVITFLITSGLAVAGGVGLILAGSIPQNLRISTIAASEIACTKGLSGCCCCEDPNPNSNKCPEWTKTEVINLIVTDFQIAGAVAFTSMLYIIGALIVASIVRQNLKNYKSDYV